MPDEGRSAILSTLQGIPGLISIYLFGSIARQEAGAESDIDLAFLARHSISAEERWNLQEQFASCLHRDVDLIDLRAANTVMRAQIIGSSVLLYEADLSARETFEADVLSAHANLNEERAAILEDVYRRGRVYGG